MTSSLSSASSRSRDTLLLLPRVFDHLLEGVSITDSRGNILWVNDAFVAITGYSREEAVGRNTRILKSGRQDGQFYERMWTSILQRGQWSGEIWNRRKNGEVFPAWLSIIPLESAGGRILCFAGFLLDITDRKEVEKRLEDSTVLWMFALEGSGDGVWDWNPETKEMFLSRQAKGMFGYEEGDIENDFGEWVSRIHPDDLERAREEIRKLLSGEIPHSRFEHRIRCKDGSYKWTLTRGKVIESSDEGKPLRVVGTCTDISEHKRAEEALREQLSFQQTLIDAIPVPIYYKDETGRYIGCNKAFASFLGLSREDIIGKTVHDVAPPKIAEKIQQADLHLLTRQGTQVLEFLARNGAGEVRDAVYHKASFLKSDGSIGGLIGAMLDITESKRAERELKDSKVLLENITHGITERILLVSKDMKVLWANKTALGEGAGLEDVLGKCCHQVLHLGEGPCLLTSGSCPLEEVQKTGKPAKVVQARPDKDGKQAFHEVTIYPVFDEKGEVLQYIHVSRDIGEEKLRGG